MGLILPGQAVAERRCWDTSCRTFSGAVSPDTFLASFFFFHLFCSFVLFWIAVKEVGFYIGWIYTSVTQHWAYPETQLPRGDMDGRNNCACVCVCVCWQGATSSPTSAIHTLWFRKAWRKLSCFLLTRAEQKQDQASCSDTLSCLFPLCSAAFLLVHTRRSRRTVLPACL